MSKRSLQSGVSPTEPPTPRRAAALAGNWITKKGAEDAAVWRPEHNRGLVRWRAGGELEYGLTLDQPERDALLKGCHIEEVLRPDRPEPSP